MKLSVPLRDLQAAWRCLDLVISDSYERCRVRFDTHQDSVSISATDLDQLLTIEVPATIAEPGSIVAPGPTLGDFIREQAGDEAVLETIDPRLVLTSPTGELRTSTYDLALWPTGAHLDTPGSTWPANQLQAIDRVAWAAARDDARPLLKGIQLQDTMAVAMDSYGMAAVRTPMAAATQVIVPARSLTIAAKLPAATQGYSFASASGRATFSSGQWRLTTTLIEGSLPEWRKLVSDVGAPRMISTKEDLTLALRRVRGLAKKEELRTVVFRPDPSGSGIVLHVSVPDVGEQTARVPGSCDLEAIGLNFERMTHAVENLPTDEVRIEVTEDGYAVIRDNDYIAVVPPVRGAW